MPKRHYIFSINLHSEDPTPPYQVAIATKKRSGVTMNLPPNTMPPKFYKGDTILFLAQGREVVECSLFVRPMLGESHQIPFSVIDSCSIRHKQSSWHVSLQNLNTAETATLLKIKKNVEGYWDFVIAGKFEIHIFASEKTYHMPFLVDPECVVGSGVDSDR